MQVDSIGRDVHSIVHLIARGHIDLEVGAHGRLDRAIQALLDLLAHLLVVVACAELLVKFVVCRGINTFDGDHGRGSLLENISASSLSSVEKEVSFVSKNYEDPHYLNRALLR